MKALRTLIILNEIHSYFNEIHTLFFSFFKTQLYIPSRKAVYVVEHVEKRTKHVGKKKKIIQRQKKNCQHLDSNLDHQKVP